MGYENSKSQNAASSWGGRRKLPNAFTGQGVAMLSGILNSDIAIEVNIRIIGVFTKLKEHAPPINKSCYNYPGLKKK